MDDYVHDEIDNVMYDTNFNASIIGKEGDLELVVWKQVPYHGGDKVVADKRRPMKRIRMNGDEMDDATIEDEGLQFGRSRGGEDRFYNPAKARRNRQDNDIKDNLRRAQSDVTSTRTMTSSDPVIKPVESQVVCNLERFLESVTPSVIAQYQSKRGMGGWRNQEERQPYFLLGDLWESFKEWSAYGAGVPLILNDTDSVVQYYVPYLSGIQLYMDPLKSSVKSGQHSEDSDADSFRDSSSDVSSDNDLPKSEISHRLDQLSLNYQHALQEGFSSDEGESTRPQGCLSFEYMEHNQPWGREPLTDKILDLARCFPELKSIKSCDLLPSSWLSVAWYPIYRIPMGPTLKDLDACFLTYHSLHTPITGNQCEHPPTVLNPGETDGVPNISLPVFGLASYKLKAPLWINNERLLLSTLLQAADNWLATLQVWKSVEYGVSNGLDTAYWGFLRVGTTFDIFQNIILFPYLEYGVLSLSGYDVLVIIHLWSLVSVGLEVGWIRRIHVLDTAYWGFLGVGTTFDIFQNIILIPYLEYGVLSPLDTAY
ncbi:hypothetical protein Tco_0381763 [Tanacetum coccineum]